MKFIFCISLVCFGMNASQQAKTIAFAKINLSKVPTKYQKVPTKYRKVPGRHTHKSSGFLLFFVVKPAAQRHAMGKKESKSPKRKRDSEEDGGSKKRRKDSTTDVSMESPKKERKEKKEKKEKKTEESKDDSQMNILEKCEAQRPFANAIASPMADVKDTKKLLSLVHKGF